MKSILMISLHGYVGANAEIGQPDTGGQVVYEDSSIRDQEEDADCCA